ncbi:MAG: DNA mismatch repair endonuclease MutL [Methanomicrobia archaeon]|nr:DNA mismatch repair endonuclease MutL [Methanomicrobia archaeon]
MRSIFILEEQTIGKIAAGEVVDRPASVVKELIENSIDAGSSHIRVELSNGGRAFIRVTDDGCGISEDDLEVAFAKHATSKIKQLEDLLSLHTLGFRGEALPSIAAVSRVSVSTRHVREAFGTQLTIEGGAVKERRRVTRGVGTSIEVKSLFYNLPARIGTLKSRSTELRHVVDVCINYAVIYPKIKFELIHDTTPILTTLGTGSMLDAIVTAYGSGIANALLELKPLANLPPSPSQFALAGYISKPVLSYGTKSHLFTYVNQRFVRSELMERAIKRGYMSLLPKHAYPFAVVSLTLDPGDMNVNIHPKKHEIQFYQADEVFQLIAHAVTTTLRSADLIPEMAQRDGDKATPRAATLFGLQEEQKPTIISVQTSFQEVYPAAEEDEHREGINLDILPLPLYQVLDSYIVAQSETDDVLLIDQHAAAERINYERLLLRYGGRIEKQALLRPLVPDFSPHQRYVLREHEAALREMGFDLERLGDDSYVIRAIPIVFHGMIGEAELPEVMLQLVEECGKREERIKVLFSTAACKASIKAGEKQSYEAMRELVEHLKATKMPFTCPHGRPTMIRLSKNEIEKRFKRR